MSVHSRLLLRGGGAQVFGRHGVVGAATAGGGVINASSTVARCGLLMTGSSSSTSRIIGMSGVREKSTYQPVLTEDNVFENLVKMEYAVRGPLLLRAIELEKELLKVRLLSVILRDASFGIDRPGYFHRRHFHHRSHPGTPSSSILHYCSASPPTIPYNFEPGGSGGGGGGGGGGMGPVTSLPNSNSPLPPTKIHRHHLRIYLNRTARHPIITLSRN
jgi:hypothetical protein